jgi:serine/threonine protein kinase/Tol biopolymer transport system component
VKEGLDINPDRWPDVSRVFSAAAPLDGPSRNAYLDDACRHDPALRAAVESLLGAHDNAGSFGEAPGVAPLGTVKRLAPESQLGPFRIESLLGAGGMGEVYRAYDTKLHRAVAIKVLPDFFAQHPDRLARFEEEARALAALNHPHVGAIYGLEESAGIVALVLELVEGPTLAERLAVGPLAFGEVVWITRQLAEGLEAAHEHGIVHRDLKPANIKITPDGNVKILDFGLAKTAGSQAVTGTASSVAVHRGATQMGAVLGTVGYMSPEQARGQAVDKRTDIWAFGCVLFEMCAHQPPFAGATISDAQAAVIEREPNCELLRADTPTNLVRLLRRCLAKDPKLRLRDIGEARIALSQDSAAEDLPVGPKKRRVAAIAAILSLVALASVVAVVYGPTRSNGTAQPSPARFPVPPPDGGRFDRNPARTFLALSPDGSQLAFVASAEGAPASGEGQNRIWIRRMADLEEQPVPGTDGATSVFWKPDSRSLAFFANRKLKRIELPTGAAVLICDVQETSLTHGTWGADGVILMGEPNGERIYSVPAAGGTPRETLSRNRSNGEARVAWPWFLPDGKRFLYTARLDDGEGELRLGRLNGGALEGVTQSVMRLSSNAQWVDPDIVVFAREGVLMGQRLDLATPQTIGEPFEIAERVDYFFTTSRAMFSASQKGDVAYHPGGEMGQLAWVDRNGKDLGNVGSPAEYEPASARLSRDDRQLLTARSRVGPGTYDIVQMDLGRGTEEQLTWNRGSEVTPVWIEGERAILFAADSTGRVPHLFRKDLASGAEEQVLPPGRQQLAMDVFPDGRVAYAERSLAGKFQMLQLSLTRGATPAPLRQSPLSTSGMRLSPDGRTMTYVGLAEVGGRASIYVAPVQVTDRPLIAVQGGSFRGSPRWSASGREIFYVSRDDWMMSVDVQTVPILKVGEPKQMFKLMRPASLLDVAGDGRFLLLVHLVSANKRPIVVDTAAISATRR